MKKISGLLLRLLFFLMILIISSCSKSGDSPTPPPTPPAITTVSPASGPKNTTITISGTNFITDLTKIQVTVNGKTCAVLTATATTITAQIPAGCGTGNVAVYFSGIKYDGPVFNFVYTYTLTSVSNGVRGFLNGPIATAKFDDLWGVMIDPNDNIFVTENMNPRIRKITSSGMVSTLAGDGIPGDVDAQGSNAEFKGMRSSSMDQTGNVYVAALDEIKKIDINGNVTTLVHTPFNFMGIKVMKSGNIYVSGFSDIAKYTSTGTLIWRLRSHAPVSGNVDGDTSIVQFYLYGNIEVDDAEKNIYVQHLNTGVGSGTGSQLKKLDLTNRTITTIAGDGTEGDLIVNNNPLACKFRMIASTLFDNSGGIYLAVSGNSKICYLKDGAIKTIIDGAYASYQDVDGDASIGRAATPYGLAFDSKGQVFIGCININKIKKLVID